MDNKRKGSDPQQSPSESDRFEWDKPQPNRSRDSFNFADDDEDGPVPAPPEFDGERGSVPDLLDGEEVVEEPIEDSDLLESAPEDDDDARHSHHHHHHHGPPPIPVGASQRGFIDDGEIALPPRMSHLVKSFPFRHVRAEDDPSAEDNLDDEPEEMEPEELDPDDLESVTDGAIAGRSIAGQYIAGQSIAGRSRDPFADDDTDDVARTSDPATGTGARWSFADLDRQSAASTPAPAPAKSWSDDEDTVAEPLSAASTLTSAGRARMFSDDSERTVADSATDDDTGIFTDVPDNTPTGLFARNDLRAAAVDPPRPAKNPAFASLPTDDELELPIDDDAPPSRRPLETAPVDDDESTAMFTARRLRDAADSVSRAAELQGEDDWVHPRGPQPSAAIPVADIDDDDDASWDLPPRPPEPVAAPEPAAV
ncbi:MAG TPA: hypothetical protein VGB85_09870, partial [Nannocystis sp.]